MPKSELQNLPSEVQEHILGYISPHYAFALLPLPGAIYRLFYHPRATSSLQILLLNVMQTIGQIFWTLFNNPAISNATKLMMAAQYSQSVGLMPSQHLLKEFVRYRYKDLISKQDRKLIAELVWGYQTDEVPLSKQPLNDVYTAVINLLTNAHALSEDGTYLEITFIAKHWQLLSKKQQNELSNLLQKNIAKITPGSFHILPLAKHLQFSSAQYIAIHQEIIRVSRIGGYGYKFLNYFFILPPNEQDQVISKLQKYNPHGYLEYLYCMCEDNSLKQKLFTNCYQYVNQQRPRDGYYLNNCLQGIRTCRILDYFDYSYITAFDKLYTLVFNAFRQAFPYEDIDSYIMDFDATQLSKLIDKIMNMRKTTYSLALSIAAYKRARQIRILESDDEFMFNIIEHIKLRNFAIDSPDVHAVVDLMSHVTPKQSQLVLEALTQNLQRNSVNPYFADDNTHAIAQIVQLTASTCRTIAVIEQLNDVIANHPSINSEIWHANTELKATCALDADIFATLKGSSNQSYSGRGESQIYLEKLRKILHSLQQNNYATPKISVTVKEVKQEVERLVRCLCKNDAWFSPYTYRYQREEARAFNEYLRTPKAHKLNQLLSVVYDRSLTTEYEISQFFKDIYQQTIKRKGRTYADGMVISCSEHSYDIQDALVPSLYCRTWS